MRNKNHKLSAFLAGCLFAAIFIVVFLVSFDVVLAVWQEPTAPPPGGNILKPLNTTDNPQVKAGGLTIMGGATTTKLCFNDNSCKTSWNDILGVWQPGTNPNDIYYDGGNVGIGTNNPNKALHVYRSSGNAEIDIQSGGAVGPTGNHWGIYHNIVSGSDDLRFWKDGADRIIFSDTGDLIVNSGDVYIATNKAIRVDGTIRTNFNIGNYNTSSGGLDLNIGGNGTVGNLNVYGQIRITGPTAPTVGQVLTATDTNGNASWQTVTSGGSGAPSGPAGGDLSSTYPNPIVAKIQGITISPTDPISGQILKYNGTEWAPADESAGGADADSVIGNEVVNANGAGRLYRSGAGTVVDPYVLDLSLSKHNVWTNDISISRNTPVMSLIDTLVDGNNPELKIGDTSNHWGIYKDTSNNLSFWLGTNAGVGNNFLSINNAGNLIIPTGAAAGYVLTSSDATGLATWQPITAGADADSVIGNEVVGATNSTLLRGGAGTVSNPYTLALNLGNSNTWTTLQTFGNSGGISKIIQINGSGEVTGDWKVGSITVGGADLAEEFVTNAKLETGTVVVLGDYNLGYKSVKPSFKKYDSSVVGVVSDNPAVIMGKVDAKYKAIVALTGVVHVKVSNINGIIKRGDLLTTSNVIGYAMKATNPQIGTIIGKAMEDLIGEQGQIMSLINLQ